MDEGTWSHPVWKYTGRDSCTTLSLSVTKKNNTYITLYYHILPYITIYYYILPYITIYYHILAISAVNLSLPTQSHIAFSEFHQSLLCSGPIPQTSTDQRPLRRPFLQPVDLINSSDRWILAVKIFLKTLDPIFFTFQTPRSEHDFVLNTIISMKKSVKVIPVKVMCGKCGRF